MDDPEANQYVDGTAIHWYGDDIAGPEVMDSLNALFPNKFQLYTESCEGEYLERKTCKKKCEKMKMSSKSKLYEKSIEKV